MTDIETADRVSRSRARIIPVLAIVFIAGQGAYFSQDGIVLNSGFDRYSFKLDSFRRDCLMGGLDEIALTLASDAAIRAYELRTGI